MKKLAEKAKRAIAILLSILIINPIIPFGAVGAVFASTREDTISEKKIEESVGELPLTVKKQSYDTSHSTSVVKESVSEPEEVEVLLGWTFNALENKALDSAKLLFSIFDSEKMDSYVIGNADKGGVLKQDATVTYASSAKEMMQKLGIETSTSAKGKMTISKVKAGFETKFSLGIDYTIENKVEEVFYQYVYRAVCEHYGLQTSTDYSKYLSDAFIRTLSSYDPNNPNSIKEFFDKYGTHVLIQYDKGAQMTLSAAAVSSSAEAQLETSLKTSMEESASVGSIASAEVANKVSLDFKESKSIENVNAEAKWSTCGGDPTYFKSFSGDSIEVDEISVKNWVESINGEKVVFLPETSKWVAIWEVIPNTAEYALLREALYNYYIEQEFTQNTEFFSKYISYSEFTNGIQGTYISPNGYVSKVTYKANMDVAPGAVIQFPIAGIENYDLVEYKVTSGNAVIDRNGLIQIKSDTGKVQIMVYGDYLPIATLSFTVKKEGDGKFSGGYGDKERPYLISNTTDLMNIGKAVDKCFIQTQTINFNGGHWTPIASFNGTYDGNGFAITKLLINSAVNNKAGFVAINNGIIKNLTISDSTISYKTIEDPSTEKQTWVYVGAVVGYNYGTIEYCKIENTKIYGELDEGNDNNQTAYCAVGGISGTSNGRISYCSVENCDIDVYMGEVVDTGDDNQGKAGGIVGANSGGQIEYAIVKSSDILSNVRGDGKKKNPAEPETVSGGIAGAVFKGDNSKISNCIVYSTNIKAISGGDRIEASYYEGAIAGFSYGKITNCYCDSSSLNGHDFAVNLEGGQISAFRKTGKEMEGLLCNDNNWAFVDAKNGERIPYLNVFNRTINGSMLKKEYVVGDIIDLSTLSVKTVRAHNGEEIASQAKLLDFDSNILMNDAGEKEIKIAVGTKELPFSINVLPVSLKNIKVAQEATQTEYYVGDETFNTIGLKVIAIYNNGETKDITNSVSLSGFDTSVATLSQTICLTYEDQGGNVYTAEQRISVSEVVPIMIDIYTEPQKTSYAEGETFDGTGCSLKIYYNNGLVETVSSDIVYSGFNGNKTGEQTITVKYSKISEKLTANFHVNVGTIQSIEIKTMPVKTQYFVGDAKNGIDTTGLVITASYSNGVTVDVDSGYTVSKLKALTPNTWETVTISLFGKETTLQVYINPVELASIEIDRLPKTDYFVGDKFSVTGLRVKAIYNNGEISLKQGSDLEMLIGNSDANDFTFTAVGNKTVTIDYYENGKSATASFEIRAVAVKVDYLEIAKLPIKLAYKVGESIDKKGMIVNAIYNNGNVVDVTDDIDSIICDMTTNGEKEATVWFNNISTTFEVTVMSPSYISVSKMPTKTVYSNGETFDYTGMEVIAYYSDGSQKMLSKDEYNIETAEDDTNGNIMVSVEYLNRSDNFYITILMPTIEVETIPSRAGKIVTVNISIDNNPGILGASFKVEHDERLTLLSAETGDALSTLNYTAPGELANPCGFGWDGIDVADNTNGILLTLTYKVPDDAQVGDNFEIKVLYDKGNIFNEEMKAVNIHVSNGFIAIVDYMSGDLNGDEIVNMQDVVLLRRYIVGGYDVNINTLAADVNGDDIINMQDVVLMRRYIVGGYGVELQ